MASNPFRYAQVHRFRDYVAAHIDGSDRRTPTVYLTPGEARAIAAALLACADDVGRLPFTESTVGTASIEAGATPPPDELTRIRAAVKAHDDRLNDDDKPGGSTVPTGDDYNALFSLIMGGAPPPPMPTGFDRWIKDAQDRRDGDTARRMMAERRLAVALVDRALRDGYTVSVNDGEEWTISRSSDRAVILMALATSDEDRLLLRQLDGERVGWFQFIYGNSGWDVVSDHSDNAICNAIWYETLSPLADEIEAGR